MHPITGSLVALVTPMLQSGAVDWQRLKSLCILHIEQGTNAIIAAGTTGESATLNYSEHLKVIETIVSSVAGKIPVIAGTGANSTTEAIELTAAAADLGVAACLLVTPYYNKPSQEGLYQHYAAVAKAVKIPQWLYNVPGRTCVDLLPPTVARLAEIDNILAIKEATADITRINAIRDLCEDKLAIYSGDDATAVAAIMHGAKGNVSVTANIAPHQVATMCNAAVTGDFNLAAKINNQLMPLHQQLFSQANPIPVKWALAQMKLISPSIRLPLTTLDSIYQQDLLATMSRLKII